MVQQTDFEVKQDNNSIKDETLSEFFRDIEEIFQRPLSSREASDLLSLYTDLNLSAEILKEIIIFSNSVGILNIKYIEKIAINLDKMNVKDIYQAKRMLNLNRGSKTYKLDNIKTSKFNNFDQRDNEYYKHLDNTAIQRMIDRCGNM